MNISCNQQQQHRKQGITRNNRSHCPYTKVHDDNQSRSGSCIVPSRAVLLLILCQFVPYVPPEPAPHNKGHYHHSHRPATNANEPTSFLILHKEPAVVVVVSLLHFSRWCSNLFKCAHNKSPFVLFHSTAAAAAAIREIRNGHWNRKDALLLSLPKNRLIQYPFNSSTLIDLRFTINSFSHRCCAFE